MNKYTLLYWFQGKPTAIDTGNRIILLQNKAKLSRTAQYSMGLLQVVPSERVERLLNRVKENVN